MENTDIKLVIKNSIEKFYHNNALREHEFLKDSIVLVDQFMVRDIGSRTALEAFNHHVGRLRFLVYAYCNLKEPIKSNHLVCFVKDYTLLTCALSSVDQDAIVRMVSVGIKGWNGEFLIELNHDYTEVYGIFANGKPPYC